MSTKHTPTPWLVSSDDIRVLAFTSAEDREDTKPFPVVVDCASGHDAMDYAEAAANAAHIVRCVNAHDKLVAALRDLLKEYGPQIGSMAIGSPRRVKWIAARDAVAEAEQA